MLANAHANKPGAEPLAGPATPAPAGAAGTADEPGPAERGEGGVGPSGPVGIYKTGPASGENLTNGSSVLESEFCARTGLSRDQVRRYRQRDQGHAEGIFWRKTGAGVEITQAGLIRFASAFGIPLPLEGAPDIVETLVAAKKCHVRNNRILVCDWGTESVRCRVKNARLFVPGQELPARMIRDGLWEFCGVHPTKKGRLKK